MIRSKRQTTDWRSWMKKSGIFLAGAIVVAVSTIVLYAFINISRAAERDEFQKVANAVTEQQDILVPESEAFQKPAAISAKASVKNEFTDELPSYTLEYSTWEGEEEMLQYRTDDQLDMEQAGRITASIAKNWFGVDVKGAVLQASFSYYEGEEQEPGYAGWQVRLFCIDRETEIYVQLDANTGQPIYAEYLKEYSDYAFEGKAPPAEYKEYIQEVDFLSKEEYGNAVKDCLKRAKEFMENNVQGERTIKKVLADNQFQYSADEYRGGNKVQFTIVLNDNTAYDLQYIAWGSEEIRLVMFGEMMKYDLS